MQKNHVGMFRMDLVESVPNPLMIVAIDAARESDTRAGRQEHLRLGQLLGVQEISAVD
jgi:hypothetical protein